MLTRVQVDHEIDEGAFQFCAGACETNKAAPAEFCGPLRIEKIQSGAERNVISRLGESRFLTPTADDSICAWVFASWNALMRQVRDLKNQILLLIFSSRCPRIQFGDLLADLPHVLLDLVRCFPARFLASDLFAQSFAIGVQLLQRGFQFSSLRI